MCQLPLSLGGLWILPIIDDIKMENEKSRRMTIPLLSLNSTNRIKMSQDMVAKEIASQNHAITTQRWKSLNQIMDQHDIQMMKYAADKGS
ncbi:hypothetical protein GJ496_009718 [Pomphorhynchus laevis]|nr:hypothetical protein GJ496_009718 [Pomphorhynchus laevis]